ncbi:hypothetical protein [Georgenia subflava]|uniref:hypothetical protein n=1 Tax=Georgenia subflava TaxID=1622177 RepID=UPI00186ADC46|nr:hypothetical protein [Georgenia subflava]
MSHSHTHLTHRGLSAVASRTNATVRLVDIVGDAKVLRPAAQAGEVDATKTAGESS